MNPGFTARGGALVVSHKAAVAHQPTKGPLDNPTVGQQGKSLGLVRALDDLYLDLGPMICHPLFKGLACVAPIGPDLSQKGKPSGNLAEQLLGTFSLRAVSG